MDAQPRARVRHLGPRSHPDRRAVGCLAVAHLAGVRGSSLGLLAVVILSACTATSRPQRWTEVRSPNFVIVTDVPDSHAATLSSDLEFFRAVVQEMTGPTHLEARVPTRIYAFQSTSQARDFLPGELSAGVFFGGLRANTIAVDTSIYTRPIVYHEYVHFVLRTQDSFTSPLWYEEGYAEFLGGVRVEDDRVIFGGKLVHRRLPSGTLPSFADVVRTRSLKGWDEKALDAFYLQSWLIVHYFTLGPGRSGGDLRQRVARYVDRLDRSGDEDDAFAAAFGMHLDALDRVMQDYARARTITALRRPREMFRPATGHTVHALPEAEIATQLGWLALRVQRADVAEQLFDRALAIDANRSRAHAGLGEVRRTRGDFTASEAAFQRALELEPEDFENHLDYGVCLHERARASNPPSAELFGRARRHFQRAVELAPEIPEGHARLGALYLALDEDPKPGIASLETALRILPAETELRLAVARLYLKDGQPALARDMLRQVLQRSTGGATAENAAALLRQIDSGALQPAVD